MNRFCKFCRRDLDQSHFGDVYKEGLEGIKFVASKQRLCKSCNRVRSVLYKIDKKLKDKKTLTDNDNAVLKVIVELAHNRHNSNIATIYVPTSLRPVLLELDPTLKDNDNSGGASDTDALNVAVMLGMCDAAPSVSTVDTNVTYVDIEWPHKKSDAVDEPIIEILSNFSRYAITEDGYLTAMSRDDIYDKLTDLSDCDSSIVNNMIMFISNIIRACVTSRNTTDVIRVSRDGALIMQIEQVTVQAVLINKPVGVIMQQLRHLNRKDLAVLFNVYDVLRSLEEDEDDDY